MTFNNEIEKLKSKIKVLQAKVEFLEKLDRVKMPVEEAYKEWWGEYPNTNISDTSFIEDARWAGFQAGWEAAQPKDVEVNETPIPQTLYEIIKEWNDDDDQPTCEELADKISVWLNDNRFISYSDCNEKWNECIDYLRGKIK
jgi:hypothetical protein